MITRRRILTGSLGLALVPAGAVTRAGEVDLVALAGKKPLVRRTFRPPNFETPLKDLRAPLTANDAFFVRYHLSAIPEPDAAAINARTWRLQVGGGSAERAMELSLDNLRRDFEHVTITAINQCSGNRRGLFTPRVPGVQWEHGAIGNAEWTGVRLRDVLRRAGVAANALEVVFSGADSALLPATPAYVKSLPIERALDENALIAFEMNGKPLPHWNGAPARLVVPGWTATYWMKHLTELRIEATAFDGFWMKSGYRVPAGAFPGARFPSQENAETVPITEILVNSLITSHTEGERVARGKRMQLEGWAWDGGSGIATVEVSRDGGRTWQKAALGKDMGRFAWRGFRMPIDTSKAGAVNLLVRATSRSGAVQPEGLTPNPSGYHHNAIQAVTLEVV